MSALLASPKVDVHVGDGFKFLAENTASYDVIITDSSDPVGPAESLFEKPYFQLLHDALTPGGNISSQAECVWLRLPLIRELRETMREIFPAVEYAFTTVPTYPSGQIGLIVCSKEQGRDLKTPLYKVPGTKYYNEAIHKAAFVLPEFSRALIEEGDDIAPKYGHTVSIPAPARGSVDIPSPAMRMPTPSETPTLSPPARGAVPTLLLTP